MRLIMTCLCCGEKTILHNEGGEVKMVDGECLTCFKEYEGDYTKHPRNKEEVWKTKTESSSGVPTTNGKRNTSRRR
jgi:hypothetical protein